MKNNRLQMLSKMDMKVSNQTNQEETKESTEKSVEETSTEQKNEESIEITKNETIEAEQDTPKTIIGKYDIKKELNEKELTKLEEFKKMMEEDLTNEKRKKFCTDITFVRYLRARKWSKKKAKKMLLDTFKWREEFKPEELTVEDIKVEIDNKGKMYRGGHDKLKHPIIYMKPRNDNTEERIPKVKYLVYLLEKSIARLEEDYTGVTQVVILIDFGSYNPLSGVKHTGTNKEVLGILQDHYPERLFRAYIVNQGWLMNAFWSVLNPFMDPKTKEKIQMLKSKTEKDRTYFEKLLEDIDEEQLEVEYGGKNDFAWDYEREYRREEDISFNFPRD